MTWEMTKILQTRKSRAFNLSKKKHKKNEIKYSTQKTV